MAVIVIRKLPSVNNNLSSEIVLSFLAHHRCILVLETVDEVILAGSRCKAVMLVLDVGKHPHMKGILEDEISNGLILLLFGCHCMGWGSGQKIRVRFVHEIPDAMMATRFMWKALEFWTRSVCFSTCIGNCCP